ncbi:MAG: hypothetical protein JNL66_02760 [Alphaproteobacteria bacterium]|nr:hypothetical protein [Alphaproteobacteria bacterium]
MTAIFAGTTLLDEIYTLRRQLVTARIEPVERALRQSGPGDGARIRLQAEAGRLRFKLSVIDHLLDVFRLHDAAAVSIGIEQELMRVRRERAGLISDAQIAAIGRVRLRTLAIERQVACVYGTLALVESDGLRNPDFAVAEAEFEALDARFSRWHAVWEREVAPVLASFCRTHAVEDDRRLRTALADYTAQIRLAEALRAPLVRRVVAMPAMPSEPLAKRHANPAPAMV